MSYFKSAIAHYSAFWHRLMVFILPKNCLSYIGYIRKNERKSLNAIKFIALSAKRKEKNSYNYRIMS